MRLLALDIGEKRTGMAFSEIPPGFVVALETFSHKNSFELANKVAEIIHAKKIDELIVGYPLLPGGGEGTQARSVKKYAENISNIISIPISFIDERFTSKVDKGDKDARAACAILEIELKRRNI